jgi:hypothetical protein
MKRSINTSLIKTDGLHIRFVLEGTGIPIANTKSQRRLNEIPKNGLKQPGKGNAAKKGF